MKSDKGAAKRKRRRRQVSKKKKKTARGDKGEWGGIKEGRKKKP